jgi:hypothetical protein
MRPASHSAAARAPLSGASIRLGAGLCAAACIGACAKETLVVVQVPFEAEHQAAVVAVEYRGEVQLFSVDASQRNEEPILRSIEGWDEEDPISLSVSLYRESLAEMGVPGPGPLLSSSFGRSLRRGEVRERTLDQSGYGDWAATDRWPPAFAGFRYGDPCRSIDARWLESTPTEVVRFAGLVPRPDGSVLFVGRTAFDRPRFYRLTGAGPERLPLELDLRTPYAFPGNDGRVWLMGGDFHPVVYAGEPETGFSAVTETSTPAAGAWPHWSVMTPEGVIFSLSPTGELYRIEGARWEVVHRFTVVAFGNHAALSVIGEEDLFVIDPDGFALFRYTNGTVTTEPTEIDNDLSAASDRLLAVAAIPDVGMFAASDAGSVLERGEDGRWRVIQQPLILGREVWALEPIEGGVLVGGFYGVIDQFYPETGFCEERRFRYGNDLSLTLLETMEGGLAVAGFRLTAEGQELFFGALAVE